MKCASARRTAWCASGPQRDRARARSRTYGPLRRISSAPSAPSAVRARRWSCRAPILKPWTCISRKISRAVAPNAHAVVLLDQAAWHTTAKLGIPENISLVPLPPKSPELNPAENVWQYLRQNWLSNRVFDSYEAIVEDLLPSLEQPDRPTLEDHVHRPQSVGSHKSMLRAVGIRYRRRASTHFAVRLISRGGRLSIRPPYHT